VENSRCRSRAKPYRETLTEFGRFILHHTQIRRCSLVIVDAFELARVTLQKAPWAHIHGFVLNHIESLSRRPGLNWKRNPYVGDETGGF
jgi:hypothetical protein